MSSMSGLVDWSLLVLTLRARSGLPVAEFARRADTTEAMMNRLARGDTLEPKFAAGVRILDEAADYLTAEDWARVRRTA